MHFQIITLRKLLAKVYCLHQYHDHPPPIQIIQFNIILQFLNIKELILHQFNHQLKQKQAKLISSWKSSIQKQPVKNNYNY